MMTHKKTSFPAQLMLPVSVFQVWKRKWSNSGAHSTYSSLKLQPFVFQIKSTYTAVFLMNFKSLFGATHSSCSNASMVRSDQREGRWTWHSLSVYRLFKVCSLSSGVGFSRPCRSPVGTWGRWSGGLAGRTVLGCRRIQRWAWGRVRPRRRTWTSRSRGRCRPGGCRGTEGNATARS